MGAMSAQDHRDAAASLERTWANAKARGILPPYVSRTLLPTFLDAIYLGQLLNRRTPEYQERPLNLGAYGTGLVQWTRSGAPMFNLTHGAAAAFALTDTAALSWADFKLPFDFFGMTIPQPNGPLSIVNHLGQDVDITQVFAFKVMMPSGSNEEISETLRELEERWTAGAAPEELERVHAKLKLVPHLWIQGDGPDASGIHRVCRIPDDPSTSLESMLNPAGTPGEWWAARNKHTMRVICQMLVSLCAYLDGSGTTNGERWYPSKLARNKAQGKPTYWTVGGEIKLPAPVREAARAFGRADRDAPAWHLRSKMLVRGHWKMQRRGKGRQERVRIFVQPYWRGPEAADVIQRIYTIGATT